MNKPLLKKWIKALESGRYKQTIGKLGTKKTGYCCLGVLCKVARVKFLEWDTMPPDEFLKRAGLDNSMEANVTGQLASLNDQLGLPFEVIAANLRGLFDV